MIDCGDWVNVLEYLCGITCWINSLHMWLVGNSGLNKIINEHIVIVRKCVMDTSTKLQTWVISQRRNATFLTKILDFWRKRLCKEPDSQRPLLPGRDIHNEPCIGNWKKLQLLNNFHHFFFFNNLYLGNL